MVLLLLCVAGLILGLAGLVPIWRHEGRQLLLGGLGILGVACVLCFTAESWYALLGYSRGDGQVFIGYYLVGLAGVASTLFLAVCAGAAASFRPRPTIEIDDADVASGSME